MSPAALRLPGATGVNEGEGFAFVRCLSLASVGLSFPEAVVPPR